jgi:pimeloyl-ACP methyl ester carboxylesterase
MSWSPAAGPDYRAPSMGIRQERVTANGLEFSFLEAGSGPLALCLHGFPDSPWTWRHLLPTLADAGFHAVAPWMRGYAPTDVPADGLYQTGALAADAVALHEALEGDERAVIIGHDWGATATYGAATHAPDRWRRVVAAAVPPVSLVANAFFDYAQIKRSFYMWYFQTPLAELAVPMNDLRFIDELWQDWSPGYDGAEDIAHVKEALREPANLSAALGYYRAMFDPSRQDPKYTDEQIAGTAPPPQPTLYLHGRGDGCIGVDVTNGAEEVLGPRSRVERIEGAGHFLHLEQPTEVNRIIVEWVTA